nr:RecName: Full=Pathogenesis-related protein [Ephedra distachya]
DLDVNVFNR